MANQFALNNYEIYAQEVRDLELEIACSVKIWNEKLNELTEDLKAIFKHLAKKSTAWVDDYSENIIHWIALS